MCPISPRITFNLIEPFRGVTRSGVAHACRPATSCVGPPYSLSHAVVPLPRFPIKIRRSNGRKGMVMAQMDSPAPSVFWFLSAAECWRFGNTATSSAATQIKADHGAFSYPTHSRTGFGFSLTGPGSVDVTPPRHSVTLTNVSVRTFSYTATPTRAG